MSYIVFARKYRPQVFDDIVGQSHITTTLKNAILQNRVSHAYIFAGPRGVGKTTTARILAKAINCEKGPTPAPCDLCDSCKEITKTTSLDILEIDGASNRGIDEIRNLKESVKFAPARGRFKVYIIDEVHMFTPEAFNALLKTLEEPPPHIKFIFATTQAHKVPPTILSRCQRFDFRRLSTKDILDNLRRIAKDEGLNVKDEALILMAKYADGSMRDGQVILDQMASFAEGRISPEDVTKVLGTVDEEIIFGLSKSISDRNARDALKIIDQIASEGKDIFQVITSLIEHFRNLSLVKISKDLNSIIDAGAEKIRRYEKESEKFSIEEILYVIYTLASTIDFIRKSNLQRFPFEAAVIKLVRRDSLMSLDEISRAIGKLEINRAGQDTRDYGAAIPKEPKESASSSAPMKTTDVGEVLSAWGEVIKYIKTKKISIASYLQEGYPAILEGKVLSIAFSKELQFHKEVLEKPDNRFLIEEAVRSVLDPELKVTLVLEKTVDTKRSNSQRKDYLSEDAIDLLAAKEEDLKKQTDPIIKTALEIFGGDIIGESDKKGKAK